MALGDIQFLTPIPGAKVSLVQAGTTESILAGEPVAKTLGAAYATASGDNTPVVATDFWAGIATINSTETASLDGIVEYIPIVPGVIFEIVSFG